MINLCGKYVYLDEQCANKGSEEDTKQANMQCRMQDFQGF